MFETKRRPKPGWLKAKIPSGDLFFKLKKELEEKGLFTICQSARCPNVCECWNNSHATFLVLGNTCTRNCLFCSVPAGSPGELDPTEAEKILEMIRIMKSRYVVITSVTRDDLEDGGSGHFAHIIEIIRKEEGIKVEALIPDFKGNREHLDRLLAARPDVLGHNLETVKRLYPRVNRPEENYRRSLEVLKYCKEQGFVTKSGLMVGMGETMEELDEAFKDLRNSGTDLLTLGQYLQPTDKNLPVEKYYSPTEFEQLKESALSHGFLDVASGPFVRSSYHAENMQKKCSTLKKKI